MLLSPAPRRTRRARATATRSSAGRRSRKFSASCTRPGAAASLLNRTAPGGARPQRRAPSFASAWPAPQQTEDGGEIRRPGASSSVRPAGVVMVPPNRSTAAARRSAENGGAREAPAGTRPASREESARSQFAFATRGTSRRPATSVAGRCQVPVTWWRPHPTWCQVVEFPPRRRPPR